MSKTGKGILGVVALLVLGIGVGAYWVLNNLGRLVEEAVETHGPPITGTEVSLGGAMISIFSGEGALRGLHIGNPETFEQAYAFELGRIAVTLVPKSVVTDVVRIPSIVIEGPKLIAEFDAAGGSNLKTILNHARGVARGGGASKTEPGGKAKKIIIDDFQFLDAEVRVVAKEYQLDKTLKLKRIQLKGLGAKQGGAAAADIAEQVLRPVVEAAVQAALQEYIDAQRGKLEDKAKDKLMEKLFK